MKFFIDGQKFDEKEDYFARILEILALKPMTPTQLAERLGKKSREAVQRNILKPLLEQNLIEKLDFTKKYTRKFQISNVDVKIPQERASAEKKVMESESMKKWAKHNSTKKKNTYFSFFRILCSGKNEKVGDEFAIYPDSWSHPATTTKCVEILEKKYGVGDVREQLPATPRGAVRQFLKYGLGYNISKEEAEELHIGGHKDNVGAHATIGFEEHQYKAAIEYCKKNPKVKFVDATFPSLLVFEVHLRTFVRPSEVFTIRLDQIQFFNRKIEYVEAEGRKKTVSIEQFGEKITPDESFAAVVKYNNIPTKTRTERACHLKDVIEHKTSGKSTQWKWPKWILANKFTGDEIVKELENYVESRLHRGKKYLFWENNKSTFELRGTRDFRNYDSIVRFSRQKWNVFLKGVFKSIGCTEPEFFEDTTYAMRHCGVQEWCNETEYDLVFICEMGWNDMATLRDFYARMRAKGMARKLAKVVS